VFDIIDARYNHEVSKEVIKILESTLHALPSINQEWKHLTCLPAERHVRPLLL